MPIDQVRNISNIFKGKTGTDIAIKFSLMGHDVRVITSNEYLLRKEIACFADGFPDILRLLLYARMFKTYDELYEIMEQEVKIGAYDVIIHTAAVSDYKVAEVCMMDQEKLWAIDKSNKVSSAHEDLYLHLVKTPKIIDLIREPWKFKGYLVKFKLQVDVNDHELIKIAKKSRVDSGADMIVANCLEWAKERAFIITNRSAIDVGRKDLPDRIHELIYEEIGEE